MIFIHPQHNNQTAAYEREHLVEGKSIIIKPYRVISDGLKFKVTSRRLAMALIDYHDAHKSVATNNVLKVCKQVRQFLNEDKKRGRNINKKWIYTFLLYIIGASVPLKQKRKDQNRNVKAKSGIKWNYMQSVSPASSCYRSQLYWTLMFETYSPIVEPNKKQKFMSPTEASELVAKWLVCLGLENGMNSNKSRTRSKEMTGKISASEKRCGRKVSTAAKAIRVAYQRWNVRQKPNCPLGVYGSYLLKNGEKYANYSTDRDVIKAHQW